MKSLLCPLHAVIEEEIAVAQLIEDLDGSRDWTIEELNRVNAADLACQELARNASDEDWVELRNAMLRLRKAEIGYARSRFQHRAVEAVELRRIDHCTFIAQACDVAARR